MDVFMQHIIIMCNFVKVFDGFLRIIDKNSVEIKVKPNELNSMEIQRLTAMALAALENNAFSSKTIDILYTLDSASLLVKLKPRIFQRLPPFE